MNKKFTVIVADPPWGGWSDNLKMSDVARGAQANYDTMSISQIKQLPIKDLISPDGAILALWVPSSLLQEGLDTMKAWEFNHKQTYIWIKTKKEPLKITVPFLLKNIFNMVQRTSKRPGVFFSEPYVKKVWKEYFQKILNETSFNDLLAFGMGRLFRNTHEICLIGISNNKIYKKLQNRSQRSVCFAENLKHSTKPDHLQDSLELMFPNQNYLEIFGRRLKSNWHVIGNQSPTTFGEDIFDSIKKLT